MTGVQRLSPQKEQNSFAIGTTVAVTLIRGTYMKTKIAGCLVLVTLLATGCSKGFNSQGLSGANSQSSSALGIQPKFSSKNASGAFAFGGSEALAQRPDVAMNPNSDRGTPSQLGGNLVVPYTMADGSGSGSCNYEISMGVNVATPGYMYNVVGKCQSPKGDSFDSTGNMYGCNNGANCQLVVGLGSFAGNPANLRAIVDLNNRTVSNVTVTGVNMSSGGAGTLIASHATYSEPSSVVLPPNSSAPTASSVSIQMKLSDGSTCSILENAVPGSLQAIAIAKCNGGAFTLTGISESRGSDYQYVELKGVGPNGSSYSVLAKFNPSTGAILMTTGSTNIAQYYSNSPAPTLFVTAIGQPASGPTAPAPAMAQAQGPVYRLAFSGASSGTCGLQVSNDNGDTSFNLVGECALSNSQQTYATSGTASNITIGAGAKVYQVNLGGSVNNTAFKASFTYDSANSVMSGTWSTMDPQTQKYSVQGTIHNL